MTALVKVVFVADKLEPERDKACGDLGPIRLLAKTDLDQAILKLYAYRIGQLQGEGKPTHEDLTDAQRALMSAYFIG